MHTDTPSSPSHDNIVFCENAEQFLYQTNHYYANLCKRLAPDGDNPNIKFDLTLDPLRINAGKVATRIMQSFEDNKSLFANHSLESRNERMDLILNKMALSFVGMGQHKASVSGDKWNKKEAAGMAFLSVSLVHTITSIGVSAYTKYALRNVRTINYSKNKDVVIKSIDRIFSEVAKLTDQEVAKQHREFYVANEAASSLSQPLVHSNNSANNFKPSAKYFIKYLDNYLNASSTSKILGIAKYSSIIQDMEDLLRSYAHNENDQTIDEKNQRLELIVRKVGIILEKTLKTNVLIPSIHYPCKDEIHNLFETYKSKSSAEIGAELTELRASQSFARYDQRPIERNENALENVYKSLKEKSSTGQGNSVGKEYSIPDNSRIAIKINKTIAKHKENWLDQQYERSLLVQDAIATFIAEEIGSHKYSYSEDTLTKSSLIRDSHPISGSFSAARKERKATNGNQALEVPQYDYVNPETGINNKVLITEKLTEICNRITAINYDEIQTAVDEIYNKAANRYLSPVATLDIPEASINPIIKTLESRCASASSPDAQETESKNNNPARKSFVAESNKEVKLNQQSAKDEVHTK